MTQYVWMSGWTCPILSSEKLAPATELPSAVLVERRGARGELTKLLKFQQLGWGSEEQLSQVKTETRN